jgi:hypothetical protein
MDVDKKNPKLVEDAVSTIGRSGKHMTNLRRAFGFLLAFTFAITSLSAVAQTSTDTLTAAPSSSALQFIVVTPCRLVDTRPQYGGSGPIQGGTSEAFNLPQLAQANGCASLSSAGAYVLSVTVVPNGRLSYLTVYPTGENPGLVTTMHSLDGRIKSDAAIVPAGANQAVSVYVSDTTNVVLDINGYFAPVSGSTLAFYPLGPCRVADTRSSSYPPGLGAPFLTGGQERDFPVLESTCIPGGLNPVAYSMNFTAVPRGPLQYLTVWPTGETQPLTFTLTNPTGTVVANAGIAAAGLGGDIAVYPTNDTDFVIDINGFFAPPGLGGQLSLYPIAPCHAFDSRKTVFGFTGMIVAPVGVPGNPCGLPATAQAFVFNATVFPQGALGYLTLWPDGEPQPIVSTLTASDGAVTSNMAIVPTLNGYTDAYASSITQLVLDISSYFAP